MSEQETQGGTIEPGSMAYVASDPGPEIVSIPGGDPITPKEPMPFLLLSGENARKFIRAEVRRALDELAEEMRVHSALQPTGRIANLREQRT